MGQKGFGRCFQRDEGGRSVEVAHISQRIKGTERKFEGHEEKHHWMGFCTEKAGLNDPTSAPTVCVCKFPLPRRDILIITHISTCR